MAATPYFSKTYLDKIIFSKTKKTININTTQLHICLFFSFFFTALQIIKTDYLTKTKNQHQKDNDHDFFNSKHKNAENKQFRAMANVLISYNLIQKNISLYNKPKKALKESSNNHIEENKLKCKNNKTDLSEDKCVTR